MHSLPRIAYKFTLASFVIGAFGGGFWSAILWAFIPAGKWMLILPLLFGLGLGGFTFMNFEVDTDGND